MAAMPDDGEDRELNDTQSFTNLKGTSYKAAKPIEPSSSTVQDTADDDDDDDDEPAPQPNPGSRRQSRFSILILQPRRMSTTPTRGSQQPQTSLLDRASTDKGTAKKHLRKFSWNPNAVPRVSSLKTQQPHTASTSTAETVSAAAGDAHHARFNMVDELHVVEKIKVEESESAPKKRDDDDDDDDDDSDDGSSGEEFSFNNGGGAASGGIAGALSSLMGHISTCISTAQKCVDGALASGEPERRELPTRTTYKK